MREAFHAVLRVISFLTRIPVPSTAFAGERLLGRDAWAFPVAGLAAALPAAGALLLGNLLDLSVPTSAIGATVVLVLVTGALHEDGLADVADGLGGHHGRERALEIMKDSRIGAYGALALILSLFLRISLLADLAAGVDRLAALLLVLAAAASRGAMAWLWSSLPLAKASGIAAAAGAPSGRMGLAAAALGAAILALPMIALGNVAAAFLPLAFAGFATLLFRRFLRRRLGGVTGDCLGAAQQLAEIAILLGFALAFKGS
ncbi:adenosylcobinamide-GDP ribazoletransferase [Aureimonas leprariae]|uniref:Adenosylcobinamide-GDP ribazoletransferase n=1 Tax=Plantimonas leprariae TaxID=2615207 RepID=A0A7V7PP53_9HYPH|nr:adenosylcobinamide-GDP ribazoletransferase [Aureimonas leprariae]KAB0679637.1 adenosylcobinamide-GDP ribazoletransferase [Aureimonas leprariae]